MTSDRCREFEAGLRDFSHTETATWKSWLENQSEVEQCISQGLRRCRTQHDWYMWELYVIAARRHPSQAFTEDLCATLRLRSDEMNNEDIVEALAANADPRAVDCLEETLWWEPEWDEFRGLAIKVVWALTAIGTPESIEVLRDAAATADERTRLFAESALLRFDSSHRSSDPERQLES